MKKMLKFHFTCRIAFFLVSVNCAHAGEQSDDILDFIPAIVAASATTINSCDVNGLSQLRANSTLIVECDLNLGSGSVILPRGVKFRAAGGTISAGSLTFNGGTIDGSLLSINLTITGDVKLEDPTFKFNPIKWEIAQVSNPESPRPPTRATALRNHRNIQTAIDLVKRLGATTFEIDRLNAYFVTESIFVSVISVPSDFHLKMSSNTKLRVFPLDDIFSPIMIRIYAQNNIKVSGGFIIGDRLEHGPTEGGNVTFSITGGQNIVVDNIHVSLSSSTGLTVNSILFEGDPRYIASKNVLVTNSTFDSNRNNNLSITDGENIRVENSKLYRAGINLPARFGMSLGRAPRIGIVIEPVQGQVVNGVTIRNNTVLAQRPNTNSILAALGSDFEFTGNTTDGTIGWTSSSAIKVTNNTMLGGGVIGGFSGGFALTKSRDNIVSGNTIRDCSTGMFLTNDDIEVFDNQIINCGVGIMLNSLKDSNIYNNSITSNRQTSFGINGQIFVDNVLIRNNTIDLAGRSMSIEGVNNDQGQENYRFTFTNNTFNAGNTGRIVFSNGINVTDNTFTTSGLGIGNAKDILFNENTVVNSIGASLSINKSRSTSNITVIDNNFNNTNSERLGAYGIRVNTVGTDAAGGNTNVLLQNNDIKVSGQNYGLHSTNFDGMTISNNRITTEQLVSIFFRGNNSTIRDNQTVNGVDIAGNGNTVINN